MKVIPLLVSDKSTYGKRVGAFPTKHPQPTIKQIDDKPKMYKMAYMDWLMSNHPEEAKKLAGRGGRGTGARGGGRGGRAK